VFVLESAIKIAGSEIIRNSSASSRSIWAYGPNMDGPAEIGDGEDGERGVEGAEVFGECPFNNADDKEMEVWGA